MNNAEEFKVIKKNTLELLEEEARGNNTENSNLFIRRELHVVKEVQHGDLLKVRGEIKKHKEKVSKARGRAWVLARVELRAWEAALRLFNKIQSPY